MAISAMFGNISLCRLESKVCLVDEINGDKQINKGIEGHATCLLLSFTLQLTG